MSLDKGSLRKLYEILSTLKYNSERREPLEEILKKFLVEVDPQMDILHESRNLFDRKKELILHSGRMDIHTEFLKAEWFKQECLLLSNIPHHFIPEYVMQKFLAFSEEFERIYTFNVNSLWVFAFKILEYIQFKKATLGSSDEIYKFESKEEYADLGFVKIPSKRYIEQWKNIITLDKDETKRVLSGALSTYEIDKVLEIVSLDFECLPKDPREIRFQSKPILQTNGNLVILTPWYLSRALPSIYENLFKKSSRYLRSKGKPFERMVQNLFKQTPFKALAFNLRYGKNSQFETDAVVRFKKSLWFIEASSHILSLKSLSGNLLSIKTDLKKTIGKCIVQGKRAIEHLNVPFFPRDSVIKGVIIVLDGVYPNLNLNTFLKFFNEKDIPIYIINWFDLVTLVQQPETDLFEDFLLWRTQKPMPVICLDEKDYWGFYFDRYRVLRDIRRAFNSMQKRDIKLFYISYRFNRKDYLQELVKAD